ncbi:hypothetical protein PV433_10330 [Paenibacillus sp. GYB004]|uniref:hypothetical protein n=1 Tax=Paenibacillus sp. GYB004 TaxID=2994393 RepID=UPI002F96B4B8
MAHTEFSAKFDGLNMASKNKLTLILPENTTDATLGKLVRMKGQQVHVTFEDPQQEMDMDDERPERKVVTFTADQHGVVQLEKQLNFDDASPADGEGGLAEVKTEGQSAPDGADQPGQTDDPADEYAGKEIVITVHNISDEGQVEGGEEDDNLIEYVFPIVSGTGRTPKKYVNGEDMGHITNGEVRDTLGLDHSEGCYAIEDLLNAGGVIQEVQDGAPSANEDELEWDAHSDEEADDDKDELSDWEREVLGEGQTDETDSPDAAGVDKQERDAAADPVDVETYILEKRPVFDDIPYDFPALLERRNAGETWKAISETIGVGNKELGNLWRRYKDKAAAQQVAGE